MYKDILDPDGGVNLARKRKTLGVAEETDPVVNNEFPSEGFTYGISVLPRISFRHIWRYLIEEVQLRKKLSTEKPIPKGYNFYKSGHVRQVFSKKEGDKFFIKSQVLPSMKKGKVYTVKAVFHPSGEVSRLSRSNVQLTQIFWKANRCVLQSGKVPTRNSRCAKPYLLLALHWSWVTG